ncbi:MAG: hypothetical protein CMH81_05425 [Nitrospiraceae bacterium]|nr:hypothetical protein [Nitrospiraceae bacterium]
MLSGWTELLNFKIPRLHPVSHVLQSSKFRGSLISESSDRREASHALTDGGLARGFTQGLGRRDAMHRRLEGGDPMGSDSSNPAASEVATF